MQVMEIFIQLIMFDGSDKEQLRKTEEFGAEILSFV
jgi:hypothetical protein